MGGGCVDAGASSLLDWTWSLTPQTLCSRACVCACLGGGGGGGVLIGTKIYTSQVLFKYIYFHVI